MNLADVMKEVATTLDVGVPILRVHDMPPRAVAGVPALIVSWPDSYDVRAAYSSGMARLTLPLVVLFGVPEKRASRDALAVLASGPGQAGTIAAVLDAHDWVSCDDVTLSSWEFDVITMGGVDYLAGVATLHVAGQG